MPSALGPAALGHTYQANPSRPCYNYYILHSSVLLVMFNVILCRFIPDDVTFDDRTATSSCSDADITKDYQPSE